MIFPFQESTNCVSLSDKTSAAYFLCSVFQRDCSDWQLLLCIFFFCKLLFFYFFFEVTVKTFHCPSRLNFISAIKDSLWYNSFFFTWLRSHEHDVLVHISRLTSPHLINARVVFLLTVKQMSQMSSQEETLKQPYLKVKCMTFTFRAWTFQSKTCMKYWKWVWKMINVTF